MLTVQQWAKEAVQLPRVVSMTPRIAPRRTVVILGADPIATTTSTSAWGTTRSAPGAAFVGERREKTLRR